MINYNYRAAAAIRLTCGDIEDDDDGRAGTVVSLFIIIKLCLHDNDMALPVDCRRECNGTGSLFHAPHNTTPAVVGEEEVPF